MTESTSGRFTGRSVRRQEDPRLLRGQGAYVSDLTRPGLLHMAILRSPHAHARLDGLLPQLPRRGGTERHVTANFPPPPAAQRLL